MNIYKIIIPVVNSTKNIIIAWMRMNYLTRYIYYKFQRVLFTMSIEYILKEIKNNKCTLYINNIVRSRVWISSSGLYGRVISIF